VVKKPYRLRKCRVCGTPFILGLLDPDVKVCPFHFYQDSKVNPRKLKPIKNPYSRMLARLKGKLKKKGGHG